MILEINGKYMNVYKNIQNQKNIRQKYKPCDTCRTKRNKCSLASLSPRKRDNPEGNHIKNKLKKQFFYHRN